MIVVVMGMSKSGTTLVSKTLHESGINMYPEKTGDYKHSKYEDPEAIKILMKMIGVDRLQSLYIPEKININDKIISEIKKYIASKKGDWGFKQPYTTLCYKVWKKYLPPHIAVGIKRTPKGLLSHWEKRHKKVNKDRVLIVQSVYNELMKSYGIPVINFEDFLKRGPRVLQDIVGIYLKDVRV